MIELKGKRNSALIFADKIDSDESVEKYRNTFISEVYKTEPDAKRHNEAWAFNQFWAGRDFGHVAPDWDRLFTLGVGGIIDEAKRKRATATADKIVVTGGSVVVEP